MSNTTAPTERSQIKENRIVSLTHLAPHPRNYRRHPESQIAKLTASLHRFGQGRSIVVQDGPESLLIVAGHGIVEAARRLGYTELRADILPASWTPEQIEGYLIADNLHWREAIDDEALLATLLHEQQDAGYDLASLGTDKEWMHQLFSLGDDEDRSLEGGKGGDEYDVDFGTLDVRCAPGDIWALGPHRLACADATDPGQVAALMHGEQAVCLWTDPPYGVGYVGKTEQALTLQNDDAATIDAFLQRAFAAIDPVLAEGAALYVAHPAGALSVTFGVRFLAQGWRLHETLIWVKDSMVVGHADYHYRHEPIFFGYKAAPGRRGRGGAGWYGGQNQTTVFEVPRPKRSEDHPTMKPVSLIEAMLRNSCPPDGLVYDPFGGSGSTLIAAHRLRMRCYCCELDPRYATSILNRWEAESGQSATLLERREEGADEYAARGKR
jgi:DNA modification methylase